MPSSALFAFLRVACMTRIQKEFGEGTEVAEQSIEREMHRAAAGRCQPFPMHGADLFFSFLFFNLLSSSVHMARVQSTYLLSFGPRSPTLSHVSLVQPSSRSENLTDHRPDSGRRGSADARPPDMPRDGQRGSPTTWRAGTGRSRVCPPHRPSRLRRSCCAQRNLGKDQTIGL